MTATRGDEELLAAWRAGDRRAGELLFERYYHQAAAGGSSCRMT